MRLQFISLVIIVLVIIVRYFLILPTYKNGDIVKITSKVYSEPIVYEREQYIKLQGLKIYLPKYPEIIYSDVIVVTGAVNGDKLKNVKLLEIKENKNIFYNFRNKLITFYKNSLPESYASLVSGTVIGSKNMPESFWTRLKATGTAHVVVASGTNVTLLAGFLISTLTYFVNRRRAVFISIAGIVLYVLLSGFDAPIVRAGIMGSIVFLAQERGRIVNSWHILIYSALIMLVIKPIWITDLGFILSFTATVSLMLFQKMIDSKLQFVPNILREGLSTSLSAQIGVAPIIFVTFGQFNILSPLINALVLWTIPYIMIFGSIAGVLGLIVPVVGRLILFISFPFLLWFTKILEIFSF